MMGYLINCQNCIDKSVDQKLLIILSVKCLKKVNDYHHSLPESKVTSSLCLLHLINSPKPKDVQVTVTSLTSEMFDLCSLWHYIFLYDAKMQQIIANKKLSVWHFMLENGLKPLINITVVDYWTVDYSSVVN